MSEPDADTGAERDSAAFTTEVVQSLDLDTLTPAEYSGNTALLDIELEARLQFGAREMPLSELLELTSGDVLELDRLVSEPVDLVVGDRIVARGEVVVVGGNFGLQVTEVLQPKPRLESVRCLL